jgi:hypothetical protein
LVSAAESEVKSLETAWTFDGRSEVPYEVEGDALSDGLKNFDALRIEDVTAGPILSFRSGANGPELTVVDIVEVKPRSYIIGRRSFITQNILDGLAVGV